MDTVERVRALVVPVLEGADLELYDLELSGGSLRVLVDRPGGVDIDAIGAAVVRWWGLGEDIAHMMRRHPTTAAVRTADSDGEQLRLAASCANEAVDAMALPAKRVQQALLTVVQRYGRLLAFGLRELQEVLQGDAGTPPPQPAVPRPPRGVAAERGVVS